MEPLNYCRRMVKQFTPMIDVPSISSTTRELMRHCISLSGLSQKFILPRGGHFLIDPEFKALEEGDKLRIPFGCIALEYEHDSAPNDAKQTSSKRIIFVVQNDEGLFCISVPYLDAQGVFMPFTPFGLQHGDYLDREKSVGGTPAIKIKHDGSQIEDLHFEAVVVLSFLNALACSNVRSDVIPARGMGKNAKKALPFDSYRVLTIGGVGGGGEAGAGGGHRSPREHLRRGHIRRYESGLKIWVNATVVAAGAAGKVFKDYRIAP